MDHKHNHSHKKLQIWYCEDCRSVHLRTDNVCLSFSKQEFAELSVAVADIYEADIAPFVNTKTADVETDFVLESDLIA